MKKIEAFKCEYTGSVFEREHDVARSEFRALMKSAAMSSPAMGSIEATKIMEWLAGVIDSGIYPTVSEKLGTALGYFEAHADVIRHHGVRPASRPCAEGETRDRHYDSQGYCDNHGRGY